MLVTEENSNVVIKEAADFDISQTFDCGQCFRFERTRKEPSSFKGVALGREVRLSQQGSDITLYDMTKEEFDELWFEYFSLGVDYGEIKEKLSTDETINAAIKAGGGIRILKQELWETLISFIISQNNNIPRIKKCIDSICSHYGKQIGEHAFAFPCAEELARADEDSLKSLGLGYRNAYICETVRKVCGGDLDLQELNCMPTPEAREYLLSLKGVGGKVADCILLFGMHRYEVCPHDVWVKRIFTEYYKIADITEKKGYALASSKWGGYAGIAQQYLFFAQREGALNKALPA